MELESKSDIFIGYIIKYGFIAGTFIFSMIAKIHTIMRFRKRMSAMECVVETLLCGLGSALVIYVLLQLKLPTWVFCLTGGFSSLVITPITMIVSKEATPVLEIIVKDIKILIHKFLKTKE